MKRSEEEWLEEKILDDLQELADEREKLLMESEELQDTDMPMEKLEEIHREMERRTRRHARRRVHLRAALAAAAIMVLFVGAGVVSSGKKLYIPVIFQRDRGNETTSKVNNVDATAREYDEEEVCQEIEEKLGVFPIRFKYRPDSMELIYFLLDEEEKEAITQYKCGIYYVYVYISKDYKKSTINIQTDGVILDTIKIESCNMEIPVYIYDDTEEGEYYRVEFEYLNTYYAINGRIEKDEFLKILENILIKNA